MRKSVITVVATFFLLSSCELFKDSLTAEIELPSSMIDAMGNQVNSIHLEPGSAAILRYSLTVTPIAINHLSSNRIPRPNKSVRLGGYFFGGWAEGRNMSAEQLEWISNNLDVLSLNLHYTSPDNNLNGGITSPQILDLKRKNFKLKFYCMLFATTLREPLFDPNTMADWVVKDKNGKEAIGVRRGYDQDINHLMDLGNKNYALFYRNFIINHTEEFHADGVAIDEVMWNGYWGVDIKDMQNYSSVTQIKQTCYDWLEVIKKNNAKEVIHQAFWPEAQAFTNGVWGEASFHSWFRDGVDYEIFYHEMDYNQIIKSIKSYSERNETYIWAAYYDKDDFEQLQYSLATYLLGNNGNYAVFQPQPVYNGGYPKNLGGYDISTCMDEYEKHKDIFDIELGNPIGDFYTQIINGRKIWIRKFENGLVFSNPNEE